MRDGGRDRYEWSDPQSYEAEAGPSNAALGWANVVSMEGHWSHCDLWFQGAATYLGRQFRILGRIGGIWTVLAQAPIGAAPFALWAPEPTTRTGILTVVRGRPCDAFAVQVQDAVGAVLPIARWRLHCWGREAEGTATTAGGGAQPVIWTPRHSAGPVGVYVASAAPCLCNCIFARNDGGAQVWLQLHDLAAAPGVGAVPLLPAIPIIAGGPASMSLDALQLAVGCVLASSTTAATYTADAALSLDLGALVQ
jgi:hypothetical protein